VGHGRANVPGVLEVGGKTDSSRSGVLGKAIGGRPQ
jgi:hypothetical protein